MTGGVIEDNKAASTGVVYVPAGKAVITGGEIKNNSAAMGTLAVAGGKLSVAGSSDSPVLIHDNQATQKGGAVYVASGTATFSNVDIYDNKVTNARNTGDATTSAGGGIYVDAGNVTIADGCDIHHNTAPRGGGVFIRTGNVKMISGKIHENQGEKGGGVAQYYNAASTFYMTGGLLAGNISKLDGAGNDFYSAYEGTAAGRQAYLSQDQSKLPKAYLVQAAQMGDPRYNVWKDDTYDGNVDDDGHPTGEFVLVKTDGEGNTLPTAIGEGQLITIMINTENINELAGIGFYLIADH